MHTTHSESYLKQWTGLSVVKFICVVVLLFVHIHILLVTTDRYVFADTTSYFYKATDRLMILSLFMYMLPIIAGAVFRMGLGNRVIDGALQASDIEKLIRLIVLLVGVGFVMNLFTGGIFYLFSWNVLQLVATSFAVIVLLMRMTSVYGVAAAGMGALLVAEPLRSFFGSGKHGYAVGALIGVNDASMFWPLVPWFSVVAFGFLFAHYYIKNKDSVLFRLGAAALGVALLGVAVARGEVAPLLDPRYIWGSTVFQPKTGVVLAALGLFSALVATANWLFDGKSLKKYGIVNSYSKGILWIYAIQMPVSLWLSAVVKHVYPMDKPSVVYLLAVLFMGLTGWVIGAASIKLLQDKQLVITFKRIQ